MVSTSSFIYQKTIWQIMDFKEGINPKIMKRIFERVFTSLSYYSKVLMVRIDFKCFNNSARNKSISDYFKQLIPKLERRYKCTVDYIWVREQGDKSECPHYHTSIFLNGHKVNHSSNIIKIIESDINLNPHLGFFVPPNCYYLINRNDRESQQAAIFRLSYFAKNETKGKGTQHTKNYQTSRNKPHEPNK